ncbi:MAG: 50S ribosomal protein L5, partial [Pseudomonadota bacterium]|nr:50S ribosomal protein L5 [Pseudomonadota bacterium]
MARLKEYYKDTVVKELQKQFSYKNPMQVPKITKIVLNIGSGEFSDKKLLDNAMGDLQKITGQRPVVTKARKSVAAFKIREGWPVGCKVTLRGDRMYEFLDRLVNIAIPEEKCHDLRFNHAHCIAGLERRGAGIAEDRSARCSAYRL